MHMKNHALPTVLLQYLKDCGLTESKIANCHMQTQLCHDLGIYGEAAEDFLEILRKQYQVDLSNFEFTKYFPEEYPYDTFAERIVFNFLPFGRWFASRKVTWRPLTLAMVDAAIRAKKWQDL